MNSIKEALLNSSSIFVFVAVKASGLHCFSHKMLSQLFETKTKNI